jgi:hypothetical protein
MAKRFTDTEKWKDDWYVALNNDYRIVWQWLLDNCNHAGICKRSIGILNMMCRTSFSETEMIEAMSGRVIITESDWFVPKFLKFQYVGLHSDKPVIVSVRKELERTGYYKLIPESFGNDYLIIKDKDKDKDKDSLNNENKKNGQSKDFKVQREESFIAGLKERAKKNNGN